MIGAEPIRVGGLTYWQIKQKALNGHRSKLSAEQLGFVGFRDVPEPEQHADTRVSAGWTPAGSRVPDVDQQLEELARLRDIAPGWYALARRIVEE